MAKQNHNHHKQPMLLLAIIITITLVGVVINVWQISQIKRDVTLNKIRVQALERVSSGTGGQ